MVTDLAQCRDLWRSTMPADLFTDLWEVRDCFQRSFQRPPCFIVAEDDSGVSGLLPLSWIEESGCYGYFPGETWHGTTWLEGNRIFVRDGVDPERLLSRPGSPYHLRYLLPVPGSPGGTDLVDEIGYLFRPPDYDFDLENYYQEFSGKSRKKLRRELEVLERMGPVWRHDVREDFDLLVDLNLDRFGLDSYFADPRFREGLRSLADLLHQRGWLRLTTVSLDGEPAAVDMGCLYRGIYTLIAGGTNRRYPGVAKLINRHHMAYACQERLSQVDFLCGDFNWKTQFHLTPRPLYLRSNLSRAPARPMAPQADLLAASA